MVLERLWQLPGVLQVIFCAKMAGLSHLLQGGQSGPADLDRLDGMVYRLITSSNPA
jgi:hypothetical protein